MPSHVIFWVTERKGKNRYFTWMHSLHAFAKGHISWRFSLWGSQSFQEVARVKTQLHERAAVQMCMGCHGQQAALDFTLYHDQHLPDQPGASAGATAPQQVPLGPHPSSAIISRPQQASHPILGWCGGTAFTAVCWRIHLSVLQRQNGKYFLVDEDFRKEQYFPVQILVNKGYIPSHNKVKWINFTSLTK